MKIFIGSDHRGFYFKAALKQYLSKLQYDVYDDGDLKLDPNDDFPIFARRVVNEVLASDDEDSRGLLICGSGQGMLMAANRHKGIRASLGWNAESAREARNDEDSNILCIPAAMIESKEALDIIRIWLDTPFSKASRHVRRIKELDELE
jgi:ribose 5-phosphate isomerase B